MTRRNRGGIGRNEEEMEKVGGWREMEKAVRRE